MNIQVAISNAKQIKNALGAANRIMGGSIQRAVDKSTYAIQKEGTINVSGGRGINVITSGLKAAMARSAKFEGAGSFRRGTVHPNINYAGFVHEGTRFMAGRPFLQNAIDTTAPQVESYFKEATGDGIGNITRQIS